MKFNFKLLFVVSIFLASSTFSFSQKVNELAKFIITEATVNDVDWTDFYLDQSAYVVFYTIDENNLIYMANYCEKDNTQSYGPMYATKSKDYEETSSTYEAKEFNFNWRYTNDYDGKTGTSKVIFTKVYQPKGVTFYIKIITEKLEVIVFTGYMEGSIDFSNY